MSQSARQSQVIETHTSNNFFDADFNDFDQLFNQTNKTLPKLTYTQVGIFLHNFVRASTSVEWHIEKCILNLRDPRFEGFSSALKQKVKARQQARSGLLIYLSSREVDPRLCTYVSNYDFLPINCNQ